MKDLKCTKHAIGYIDLLGAKKKMSKDQNLCLEKMNMIIHFIKALQKEKNEFNRSKKDARHNNVERQD